MNEKFPENLLKKKVLTYIKEGAMMQYRKAKALWESIVPSSFFIKNVLIITLMKKENKNKKVKQRC